MTVSYRLLIKIAALASTCWMSMSAALAETRMALVIGNSNYATVTALPNPANDANAMAKFLSSAGFQVLQAPDLTQSDMRKTIGDFTSMVAEKGPDTVALVFYAGHGLQVDGENYLVPVDARIQREADVPLQAMRLADVMNALSTVPSKARIVILDACRNNPFSEINKASGRGLAIVDAPTGSLVSYSTAPGTEAQDGDGANSPYTAALLKVGQEPGLPIEQALKRVRLAVNDATNRQQTPWESSSLISEFTFFPDEVGRATPASAGQPRAPAGTRSEPRSIEAWQKDLKSRTPREAYEIVIREDEVEAYQAYLALYPAQSLAPGVRKLVERRQEMIAWHDAVIINTVVAYQTFLANYPSSDLAATANRLIERARSRSVSNAHSAFASVNPTCPCSQPAPALRLKRTDVTPTKPASRPSGSVTPNDPPKVVYTDPIIPPPVIVTTLPPRIHLRPRGGKHKPPIGGDKPDKPQTGGDTPPRGDGKPPYGKDKPQLTDVGTVDPTLTSVRVRKGRWVRSIDKPKWADKPDKPWTGGDKPQRGDGKRPYGKEKPQLTSMRTLEPKLTRLRREDNVRVRTDSSRGWGRSIGDKPVRPHVTTEFAPRGAMVNRGMMMNRGMSMGQRPAFRANFIGGRRYF